MSKKSKLFTTFCLTLLFLFTAAGSLFGSFAENAAANARILEQKQTHHESESIAENLPYTPSATFRFAGRQNRPAAPSSRIRPWTPADFNRQEVLPAIKFMPSVSFDLPENVSAICTAHCLCTSPVRAGPDQIFFI